MDVIAPESPSPEKAGIATVRYPEPSVLRDPKAVAESIRWTLGLDQEGGDRFVGIQMPRT